MCLITSMTSIDKPFLYHCSNVKLNCFQNYNELFNYNE